VLVASIACRVRPAKQREFLASVERLLTHTRRQRGCLDCRLAADPADSTSLTIIFEWTDRDSHDRFIQFTEYGVLRGMRFLLTGTPVVVVDDVVKRERHDVPQGWQS
jgi:quinol monooxygenase YgiN